MNYLFAEALIETIPSKNKKEDDFILQALSNDEDAYIRSLAAENLVQMSGEASLQLLLKLADDPETTVRVNAFDSLGSFDCLSARKKLKKAIQNEPDELARYYAIISYADLMQGDLEDDSFIRFVQHNDSSSICKLAYSYALYLLGNDNQLDLLLAGLRNAEDYHIRCITATLLQGLINKSNRNIILNSLYQALKIEKTTAVISHLSHILCNEDRHSFLQRAMQKKK